MRWSLVLCAIAVVSLVVLAARPSSNLAALQEAPVPGDPGELPENWGSLSPDEFLPVLDTFLASSPAPREGLLNALSARVWAILSEGGFVETASEDLLLAYVDRMTGRFGFAYSDAQRSALAPRLEARLQSSPSALSGTSFDEVARTRWDPALRAGVDRSVIAEAAAAFGASNDWRSLSPMRVARLTRYLEDDLVSRDAFSLRWDAILRPGVTDAYTFVFERSAGSGRVWLDGALIIDSGGSLDELVDGDRLEFRSESAALPLAAGDPHVLRVEFAFEAAVASAASEAPDWQRALQFGWCTAFLKWKGAGAAEASFVPAESLEAVSAPGEAGVDLACFSGAELAGEPVARRVPEVALVLSGGSPASSRRDLQLEMKNHILGEVGTPAFRTGENLGGLFWVPRAIAELTTVAEKRQLLLELAQYPQAMAGVPAGEVYHLLDAHRFMLGTETTDVVLQWCSLEPRVAFEFGVPSWELELPSFFHANYGGYWHLAPFVAGEAQRAQLMTGVTEADGSANLSVSRIATFVHRTIDRMSEWVAYLDGKLADPGLSGDALATWQIARAFAAEFEKSEEPRVLRGRASLEAAVEAAVTEATKRVALAALATRLVAIGRFEACRTLVADHAGTLAADATDWSADIDWHEGRKEELEARVREAAEAGHIAELRERLDRARADGDPVRIARYERRLARFNP